MVTELKSTKGKTEFEYLMQGFEKMGAVQTRDGVVFSMEKKPGVTASLLIYEKGNREISEEIPFPEECLIGNVVSVKVKGFVPGKHEYNFKNARKNPYAKKLKKQITINIDSKIIDYFKEQSEVSGIPYQTLINLYLADCAENKKKLQLNWI